MRSKVECILKWYSSYKIPLHQCSLPFVFLCITDKCWVTAHNNNPTWNHLHGTVWQPFTPADICFPGEGKCFWPESSHTSGNLARYNYVYTMLYTNCHIYFCRNLKCTCLVPYGAPFRRPQDLICKVLKYWLKIEGDQAFAVRALQLWNSCLRMRLAQSVTSFSSLLKIFLKNFFINASILFYFQLFICFSIIVFILFYCWVFYYIFLIIILIVWFYLPHCRNVLILIQPYKALCNFVLKCAV